MTHKMEPWNKGFLLMGLGELNNSFIVVLLKNDANVSNNLIKLSG